MSLPLSLGLAAIGGLTNAFGSSGAENQAKANATNAYNTQQGIIGRQEDGYDSYKNALYDAIRQGAFDPGSQIAQNHTDSASTSGTQLKNIAAAQAIAGYAGGDTPTTRMLQAATAQNQLATADRDAQIRQNAISGMLNQYAQLNSAGSSLNGALSTANQNYTNATNMQNQISQQSGMGMAGFVQAISPFLNQSKAATTPTTVTPAASSYTGTGLGGGSGMFAVPPQMGTTGGNGFGGGSGSYGVPQGFGGGSFNR